MAINDPIADMLTRIRNASQARHEKVDIIGSKLLMKIAEILKDEGYISEFKVLDDEKSKRTIRIFLKYDTRKSPIINKLIRISKPGRRIYVGKDDIPNVMGGLGICILSTSRGIMTGHKARELGIGGELMCAIW